MTADERIAAVRAALGLFFSPAAHGDGHRIDYKPHDSQFTLAATVGLLQLVDARIRLRSVERTPVEGAIR